ncbi:MAG: DUF2029 domain-containing protein [Bacteroidetes bacterium]|nr:DUF2029 domain-containing protein [Bacteroidota bacterium]
MDFTAYYTAGKVMNLGLNPYKNYIGENWNLWDGVAQFNHSRFLYPPIAGTFFQPLAKLNYHSAKHIWNYLNFFFVTISVFIWLKIFRFDKNVFILLITGIFTFNFFPFYALLERGQIDGATFLLLTLGIFFVKRSKEKSSGLWFSLASVFKLYSILLIPFLLIKKKYKTAIFFISGIVVITGIMYIVNGSSQVNDYILNQAPRISQYAESGTDDMRPDSWILKYIFRISRYAVSMVDGRMYLTESISFFSNASLVRLIVSGQLAIGINIPATVWSLLLIIPFIIYLYRHIGRYEKINLWIIFILIILIFSPFTWLMNLVWLIPVFLLTLKLIKNAEYKNISFALIVTGLIIITLPDYQRTFIVMLDNILKLRYVTGELLILAGMLALPNFTKGKLKPELKTL